MEKNKKHRHITIDHEEMYFVRGHLDEPIPFDVNWFITAFWMPIKHQIGEKVAFCTHARNFREFSLAYNQLAAIGDIDDPTEEQLQFCKEDSDRVMEVALTHISRIMDHIYYEQSVADGIEGVVPFFDDNPITRVEQDRIVMNGRLPMQEEYFIKHYCRPILKRYHKEHKGNRFRIHFSENGTVISVSVERCQNNAYRMRHNLDEGNEDRACTHAMGMIVCDLVDTIIKVADDYADAKAVFEDLQKEKH